LQHVHAIEKHFTARTAFSMGQFGPQNILTEFQTKTKEQKNVCMEYKKSLQFMNENIYNYHEKCLYFVTANSRMLE
jgi:hypothetical protein